MLETIAPTVSRDEIEWPTKGFGIVSARDFQSSTAMREKESGPLALCLHMAGMAGVDSSAWWNVGVRESENGVSGLDVLRL